MDEALRLTLNRLDIDPARAALLQDCAGRRAGSIRSPYVRTYADALTGKRLALISALPGCDAYGQGHELAWSDKGGVIRNGNNIFHAVIDKGSVRLIALSGQPRGAKKDDVLDFHPQLFIGGVEVRPISDMPKLINDPLNEHYQYNTLEWDYGVCQRRLRLIEGRFLGSWVFAAAPKSDITIRYNQRGKFRLKLRYARDEDTEFIPKACFDSRSEWPVVVSDSATFYPDADPETASVDGYVYEHTDTADWAAMVGGAGDYANDSAAGGRAFGFFATGIGSGNYDLNMRSIYLFDTSALPDEAVISAAALSLYGVYKNDPASNGPNAGIYSSNPGSNTSLAGPDYATLGATLLSDVIEYADWNTSGYNGFTLNAGGLAAISKTGVTKLGCKNVNYDAAVVAPAKHYNWTDFGVKFSEQGEGYQPKLVVAYAIITEKTSAESGAGADALKCLNRTADSSAAARLPGGAGQVLRPAKQANLPSRRVNL